MAYDPHEIDQEEAIRTRCRRYYPYMSRIEKSQSVSDIPFIPYRDEFIDLRNDPYDDGGTSGYEVNDSCLGSYVNRLVFNSAMDFEGAHQYCQDEGNEGFFNVYPSQKQTEVDEEFLRSQFESEDGVSINRTPRRNPNKGLRKGRRKKSEEKRGNETFYVPVGIASGIQDGHPLFTASVYQLRDFIKAEVESKVRYIHHFYKRQFEHINKERLDALVELIRAKEICKDLKKSLEQDESSIQQYKSLCDRLASQVQLGKEAKRRRRLARKQRKTGPSTSFDETGDENTQDSNEQEEALINEDEICKSSECTDGCTQTV